MTRRLFSSCRSAVVLVGVAALVLGGCGSDNESAGGDSERPASPLEEFLGFSQEAFAEQSASQQRDIEDKVSDCMNEQGFEYYPTSFDLAAGLFDEERDRAFVEEYGFGISTEPPGFETGGGEDDRNAKYVASLSQSEQEAYYEALYGSSLSVEEEVSSADDPSDFQLSGCYGTVTEEAFGKLEDKLNEFEDLFETFDEIESQITDDERVQTAEDDYVTCMADAGFPEVEDFGDAESEVYDKFSEVGGFGAPIAIDGESSGDEFMEIETDSGSSEPADPEAIAEVQDFEKRIALADYDCGEAYKDVEADVRFELETKFIEDNKAELEQVKLVFSELLNTDVESSGGDSESNSDSSGDSESGD
jgi:hypothetical protein